ncbi:MAG: hypothetical protein KAV98_05820 [Dehalococcoidia bacterium]|nr:hypothetical protein [Dehalococcoidia bacterium]
MKIASVVSTNKHKIIEPVAHSKPEGKQRNVFGDGKAAERMTNIISQFGASKT